MCTPWILKFIVHAIGYVSRSREFMRRVTSGSMLELHWLPVFVLSVTILNSSMFTNEKKVEF